MEITTKMKASYALGGLGKNIAYGLVASYTLYYYNTILGISASFVGTLLMAARIFDAFNDPIMGVVVAKTRSPWGRYKPWILTGAVLNALVMYAMFAVPEALSAGGEKVYITVTYFLCGITYTLSDIPYWSVIPAVTRAGEERESLTVWARTMAGIGAALPTIVTVALLPILGGGEGIDYYRRGFAIYALIISIFYVVTTIIAVRALPNGELAKPKDLGLKELIGLLVHNDQAMFLAAVLILYNSAMYLTTNLVLYEFQFDIGREKEYTLFMLVSGVAQLLMMMEIYPRLRKKGLTNRQIFYGGGFLAVIGYAVLTLLIFGGEMSTAKLILPGVCISLANGTGYVLATIFVGDAVDYGEATTGLRANSVVSSLQTLMVKLSSAFAVFVAGIGLDIASIDRDAAVQTMEARMKLRTLFAVPPLLFVIGALLIFHRRKDIGRPVEINPE